MAKSKREKHEREDPGVKEIPLTIQDGRNVVESALSSAWCNAGLDPPTAEQWDMLCQYLGTKLAPRVIGKHSPQTAL